MIEITLNIDGESISLEGAKWRVDGSGDAFTQILDSC